MSRDPIDVMSLLGGTKKEDATKEVQPSSILAEIPLSSIVPPVWQPRQKFEEKKLDELTRSIRNEGLLQPLLVEPENGGYRLVAGERRFRAIQKLGWEKVPVRIINGLDPAKRLVVQIAENLQREDITPIERAKAVFKLLHTTTNQPEENIINSLYLFHRDKTRLSSYLSQKIEASLKMVGKDATTVIRWLNLLKLPQEVQELLDDPNGALTPKHAGELLKLDDAKRVVEIAKMVSELELSVEETKNLIEDQKKSKGAQKNPSSKIIIKNVSQWVGKLTLFEPTDIKPNERDKVRKELYQMRAMLDVAIKKIEED